MMNEKKNRFSGARDLGTLMRLAVGAGSSCWKTETYKTEDMAEPVQTRVFDSESANQIAEEAEERANQLWNEQLLEQARSRPIVNVSMNTFPYTPPTAGMGALRRRQQH